MSPVNQPTHNKDDKCCRWVAYCLPCKKAFCPFFQSCRIEWDHPLQSLTDWWRSGKSLMLLEGTSVEPVTSQLTGTVSSRARRPVVPPYGLHRWCLAQKTFYINHDHTQETPTECLQDPMLCCSHFWQLSSIPHVLTLIVMSSASRLRTSQVTQCESSSPFYYSGDFIRAGTWLLALTGGAWVDFDKALISLSLRVWDSHKLFISLPACRMADWICCLTEETNPQLRFFFLPSQFSYHINFGPGIFMW